MWKLLKNQAGATMVQVLIAAGMIGGLSLVLSELMKQQARTKATAELNTEVNMVFDLIRRTINNTELCTASFAGGKLGEGLEGIRLSNTSDKFFCKAGERFKQTKIKIAELRLLSIDEMTAAGSQFFINEAGSSETVLELVMEKLSDVGYGGKTIRKTIAFAAKFGNPVNIDMKVNGPYGATELKVAVDEAIAACNTYKENTDDWTNVKDINSTDAANKLNGMPVGSEEDGFPFYRSSTDSISLTCIVANSDSLITECI